MRAARRAVVELVLAGAAAAGALSSATRVRSQVAVAPVLDGEPVTTSVVYDPPLLLLTLLLTAAAGVLAVLGAAAWWHSRHPAGYPTAVSSDTPVG